MLRLSLVLIACIFYCPIKAQNWNLFPENQLSHYQVDAENYAIRSFRCDSVKEVGDSTIHFFIRYYGPSENCYWQNFKWLSASNDNNFKIDSLIYYQNSMIYKFMLEENMFNFLFKPFAKPGDEWELSPSLDRKAICTEAGVATVLGVTDSVKTFKLQTPGYGNVEFQLSKTYGLLQLIPFIDFFLEVPLNKSITPYYRLIGFQSDTDTLGFQLPAFSDYFHLSAGDILLWSHTSYNEMDLTTNYYRDSLLSSEVKPNYVSYQILRKVYDVYLQLIETKNITTTYFKDDYDQLLQTPVTWISTRNQQDSEWIFHINNRNFFFSGSDTGVVSEFSENGCSFMYFEDECHWVCLESFYDTEYKVSTIEGLTLISHIWGNDQILLGSKIDGILRGSLELPVSIEYAYSNPLNIYPNPASSIIHLENTIYLDRIEIYNCLGVLVFSDEGSTEIDLSNHQAGYYHLIVYTNTGKQYSQKIILNR